MQRPAPLAHICLYHHRNFDIKRRAEDATAFIERLIVNNKPCAYSRKARGAPPCPWRSTWTKMPKKKKLHAKHMYLCIERHSMLCVQEEKETQRNRRQTKHLPICKQPRNPHRKRSESSIESVCFTSADYKRGLRLHHRRA